ncbi:MAG: NifU family protein [Acidimicrobiia bacterium]
MPVVTVTESARKVVLELRDAEADAADLALRIDVVGLGNGGREYAYELLFDRVADAGPGDLVDEVDGLAVLVPEDSVDRLRGATLDHDGPVGLVLRNPNRPSPTIAGGTTHLEGSVEHRLQSLLDGEINPSLAMHGGFAQLQRVEDDVAYVIMGGGCQGCGLAQLTLTEGIKATIEDRIPEIREVVDVTDHASGENPFYEAAAK